MLGGVDGFGTELAVWGGGVVATDSGMVNGKRELLFLFLLFSTFKYGIEFNVFSMVIDFRCFSSQMPFKHYIFIPRYIHSHRIPHTIPCVFLRGITKCI